MIYVIFGAGSHGKVVYSILRRLNIPNENIRFADVFDKKFDTFLDCNVIGGLDDTVDIPNKQFTTILSYAGSPKNGNNLREALSERIIEMMKSEFYDGHATIIDPSAILAPGVEIGTNVSIGFNSIVNIDASVANGVIVNNDVLIEHDVKIGKYSNLSPSTKIMGSTTIGEKVFIGAGSVLRNNIHVGDNSIIGMGSIITKDVPPNSMVIGNSRNITPI